MGLVNEIRRLAQEVKAGAEELAKEVKNTARGVAKDVKKVSGEIAEHVSQEAYDLAFGRHNKEAQTIITRVAALIADKPGEFEYKETQGTDVHKRSSQVFTYGEKGSPNLRVGRSEEQRPSALSSTTVAYFIEIWSRDQNAYVRVTDSDFIAKPLFQRLLEKSKEQPLDNSALPSRGSTDAAA